MGVKARVWYLRLCVWWCASIGAQSNGCSYEDAHVCCLFVCVYVCACAREVLCACMRTRMRVYMRVCVHISFTRVDLSRAKTVSAKILN